MRSILIMGMFVATFANAAWHGYEEVRDLEIDAAGIDELVIEAGSGSLEVAGVAGLDEIAVTATIQVPIRDDDKAREIIESDLVLTLGRDGERAILNGYFDSSSFSFGDNPAVRLEVRVPERIGLDVDDSSGSIVVRDITGDIEIVDSSGSITMDRVGGQVRIDDGSGSISVEEVGESIEIIDGSGSIRVSEVGGSVVVDDGSGSINVRDVEKDLIIESDGSGSVNFSDIRGEVRDDS